VAALSLAHPSALAEASQAALARLAAEPAMGDMYLAGSAALALYLDHRPVINLDWMTASNRLLPADRRSLLSQLLVCDPETRVETARDGYLHVTNGHGVALKFFYYPYPLIEPEQEFRGVWVAALLDLALMKLGAIISRGTKRDFVDFYLLSRAMSLDAILGRSSDKFGHVRDFPLQALKGLTDFSVAVGEPMPRLRAEISWDTVRDSLAREVRAAAAARFEAATEAATEAGTE
jgi:hypothetical protein